MQKLLGSADEGDFWRRGWVRMLQRRRRAALKIRDRRLMSGCKKGLIESQRELRPYRSGAGTEVRGQGESCIHTCLPRYVAHTCSQNKTGNVHRCDFTPSRSAGELKVFVNVSDLIL